MGPDGSGKSSVIERVSQGLSPHFVAVEYMHLRPRMGAKGRGGSPAVDPHRQPPRSCPGSVAKVAYLWFAYVIGWWVSVRPLRARSSLVLFDRYYHDMLVDPARYRYGGPMWWARWAGRTIPKPDLWILLDASPGILQARKQEVPLEETTRQRDAYLGLTGQLANFNVVDASQPLETVAAKVADIILASRT